MRSKKEIMSFKIHCAFLIFCLLVAVSANPPPTRTSRLMVNKSARPWTVRLPFLSYACSGCPPHFCDDDPAIILGYCCGCARLFDLLPVRCSSSIRCPLNGYELCQRYEYMMQCCCRR